MVTRKMIVGMLMVVLVSLNLGWAQGEYAYTLTVDDDGPSDYNTINEAIVAMNENEPNEDALGCIYVYPGTYPEQLNDAQDGNDLPAHCDLIGMGAKIDDVVIQHAGEEGVFDLYVPGVDCEGDNIVSNLKIENTPSGTDYAQRGIRFNGDGTLDNCIVTCSHAYAVEGLGHLIVKGKDTLVRTKYGACIKANSTFEIYDCNLIPDAPPLWLLESPVGIRATDSGVIDGVKIISNVSNMYPCGGYSTLYGIEIVCNYTNPYAVVQVYDTTIDLTLTSKYNATDHNSFTIGGIETDGGYVLVEDCTIELNGIEDDNDTPDPGDDGSGINVQGVLAHSGGQVFIFGNSSISTSRTVAGYGEDANEYLLNDGTCPCGKYAETGTLVVDFNTVTFDPNGDGEPNEYDPNYVCGSVYDYRVRNITQDAKYLYIQDAIDDANDWDVIEAKPSVYFEMVDFNGVSCVLTSTDPNDWDVVASTIIDADYSGAAVIFDSNEDANSVITGFTVRNGNVGVKCQASSPEVSCCIIEDNISGGIDCNSAGSPTITRNKIRANGGYGGIYISNSAAPVITSNWIYENSKGISINFNTAGSAIVRNNTIAYNSEGGVYNCGESIKLGWATDSHVIDPNGEECTWSPYLRQSATIKIPFMMSKMQEENDVDFVVFTGDFNQQKYFGICDATTTEGNLRLGLNTVDSYDIPRHIVVGNHDYVYWPGPNDKTNWLNVVKENDPNNAYQNGQGGYYSFSVKGYHFVMLDANYDANCDDRSGEVGSGTGPFCYPLCEREWLEEDLIENHPTERTFIFTHWPYYEGWLSAEEGNSVADIIELAGNVEAIFFGHGHINALYFTNGVPYYELDDMAFQSCEYEDPNFDLSDPNNDPNITPYGIIEIWGNQQNKWFRLTGSGEPCGGQHWSEAWTERYWHTGAGPTISNCILWDNGDDLYMCDANYSCISDCNDVGDPNVTHNICLDPNFVDSENDDYHLHPYSPCVDNGDPNTTGEGQTDIDGESRRMDLDGETRPGSIVDMGADEVIGKVHNINQDTWYLFIQEAIDDANDGDTIVATQHTYQESINFKGKTITLQSMDPNNWEVTTETIIWGAAYAVTFNSGEDANSVIRGFTIANNWKGISCTDESSPTVTQCILESNLSSVECVGASPIIENNMIKHNIYGIYSYGSTLPKIQNNWIYENSWGIYLGVTTSVGTICNNTIVGNSVAGIKLYSGTEPNITNCIIWDNGDDLLNCSATYSCISDVNDANGIGNITCDPCFVDADSNNFHLDTSSPCIDGGDPNGDYTGQKDIDGDPRLMCTVDMGADEVECFPADFNDYNDWVAMGKPDCWCYCWPYQCDGDADGSTEDPNNYRIYNGDVAVIAANWKKLDGDPTLNPCADIDHKAQWGIYRVFTDDLAVVTANWKKTDPELPGDCPRSE